VKAILTIAAILTCLAMPVAHAGPFLANNSLSITHIGMDPDIDTAFDTLKFTGSAGTWTGSQSHSLGTIAFEVGPNCWTCKLTPSASLTFQLKVGTITQTASIDWSWSSTGPTDTIRLTTPSIMTFVQANGEVDTLAFCFSSASATCGHNIALSGTLADPSQSATLMAVENVPEPMSLSLFASATVCLGALAFLRRNQQCAH
jgi:hypothetical protein